MVHLLLERNDETLCGMAAGDPVEVPVPEFENETCPRCRMLADRRWAFWVVVNGGNGRPVLLETCR